MNEVMNMNTSHEYACLGGGGSSSDWLESGQPRRQVWPGGPGGSEESRLCPSLPGRGSVAREHFTRAALAGVPQILRESAECRARLFSPHLPLGKGAQRESDSGPHSHSTAQEPRSQNTSFYVFSSAFPSLPNKPHPQRC